MQIVDEELVAPSAATAGLRVGGIRGFPVFAQTWMKVEHGRDGWIIKDGPWTKIFSMLSGHTSVPLPSLRSLRCLRWGVMLGGASCFFMAEGRDEDIPEGVTKGEEAGGEIAVVI
jgi:hypothetical protein